MKNKEIVYAYNSVIVQLDRISMKEAYTRLLKAFSVFVRGFLKESNID